MARTGAPVALLVGVVVVIGLGALVGRLALLDEVPPEPLPGDPGVKDQMATSIAAGRGFPEIRPRRLIEMPNGRPTALRPPA